MAIILVLAGNPCSEPKDFVEVKFYCLADGNWHIWISEKTLEFS